MWSGLFTQALASNSCSWNISDRETFLLLRPIHKKSRLIRKAKPKADGRSQSINWEASSFLATSKDVRCID